MSRTVKRRGFSDTQFAIFLVVPAMALFALVSLYPLFSSLSLAFFERSLLSSDMRFVGVSNIVRVFNASFLPVLWNTIVFSVGSVLCSTFLGFIAALLLNRGIHGQAVLRGILLFPWVTPSAVVAFIWLWIYNPNYGVLNGALRVMEVIDTNVHWLGSPTPAMIGLIVAKTWSTFPWMMTMFLAGLQTVPRELVEASAIDGAGPVRRLWYVTIPHLRNLFAVVLLLGTIGNFQHFETIYVLTEGGPFGSTTTLAVEMYRRAFQSYDLGMAGALGLLWMVVLSVLAIAYFWVSERTARREGAI
ncbi:sugar ABC transporter permease [Aureimonas fodinaquatilis]|uniref:Sugar ABC transporter permease n=1 Tax=Aureimonas fodinaquatilis TaxID=2565783 RepID=A0A5B0DXZ4_9HYPH|nr:sugar ABC transporter permease [Aureimonas fodinaquatilis]KAA0970755.1 sugar ABC transporter permease [Aureimonas fodinaquatilis]